MSVPDPETLAGVSPRQACRSVLMVTLPCGARVVVVDVVAGVRDVEATGISWA